jgi:hypothetical protein
MRHRIGEKFSAYWRRCGKSFGCIAPEFGALQYDREATEQLRRNIMESGFRAGYAAALRAKDKQRN